MCSSMILWCVGLWSVWVTVSIHFSCVEAEEIAWDPYQRAKYHFDELMKSLDEIKTSRVLRKRSVDGNKTDVELSLEALCAKLDHESTAKTGASTSKESAKADHEIAPALPTRPPRSYWTKLGVFPVKVTAEREGTNVKIAFDVIHTSPISVVRTDSFDYQKRFIAGNGKSKVEFLADASECFFDPPGKDSAYFLFHTIDDSYAAEVSVDMCKFDKEYNEDSDNSKDEWVKKKGRVFSQVLPTPRFKILGDQGDEIFITKGENPVFEVDFNFYLPGENEFDVYGVLWDWDMNRYAVDMVQIQRSRDKTKLLESRRVLGSQYAKFLQVDILNKVVFNETVVQLQNGNGERKYRDVGVKIRVTVNVGSKKMSGQIRFLDRWREQDWHARPVVRGTFAEKAVLLKLPYKISVYPRNEIVVEAEDTQCDETGNRGRPDYGKNCTVSCRAWGTDIQAMFIVKGKPYRPPVRTTTYVVSRDIGYVLQDMGPTSDDLQGTYQCMVMTKNGKLKRKSFKLFTSIFTKVKGVTVENFSNGTSLIKCSAFGAQPLNFTLTTRDRHHQNEERLDNKTNNVPVLTTEENETNFTLLIESKMLRYPRTYLVCQAGSERGFDSEILYLGDIIPKHYDAVKPRIKQNKSSITKYGDDKTKIMCSASKVKDLEMSILYGEPDRIRIDEKPGNIRTVTETDDTQTLTLIVPTSSIPEEKHWLTCVVKNEFGREFMTFNLHDYFSTLTG